MSDELPVVSCALRVLSSRAASGLTPRREGAQGRGGGRVTGRTLLAWACLGVVIGAMVAGLNAVAIGGDRADPQPTCARRRIRGADADGRVGAGVAAGNWADYPVSLGRRWGEAEIYWRGCKGRR